MQKPNTAHQLGLKQFGRLGQESLWKRIWRVQEVPRYSFHPITADRVAVLLLPKRQIRRRAMHILLTTFRREFGVSSLEFREKNRPQILADYTDEKIFYFLSASSA